MSVRATKPNDMEIKVCLNQKKFYQKGQPPIKDVLSNSPYKCIRVL